MPTTISSVEVALIQQEFLAGISESWRTHGRADQVASMDNSDENIGCNFFNSAIYALNA